MEFIYLIQGLAQGGSTLAFGRNRMIPQHPYVCASVLQKIFFPSDPEK